jgi:hypothetical protein
MAAGHRKPAATRRVEKTLDDGLDCMVLLLWISMVNKQRHSGPQGSIEDGSAHRPMIRPTGPSQFKLATKSYLGRLKKTTRHPLLVSEQAFMAFPARLGRTTTARKQWTSVENVSGDGPFDKALPPFSQANYRGEIIRAKLQRPVFRAFQP